jgi:hypothetical protein
MTIHELKAIKKSKMPSEYRPTVNTNTSVLYIKDDLRIWFQEELVPNDFDNDLIPYRIRLDTMLFDAPTRSLTTDDRISALHDPETPAEFLFYFRCIGILEELGCI